MSVSITRGYTFGSTELVTNTKLHTLVDSATISGIDETVFASGKGIVVRSTSAPSSTDCLWADTNCTPPVVKIYTGTEWQGTGAYAVLTNKSGGSLAAGDVAVIDTTTDGSVTTTTTAGSQLCPVVAMQSVTSNADGVFALPGARVSNISCNGAVTRGQFLKTHTVAKQAVATSTADAGVFAIALAALGSTGALGEALLLGGVGGFALPSKAVKQVIMTVDQTARSFTAPIFPADNTVPQNTEGVEYTQLATTITPTDSSNVLLFECFLNVSQPGGSPGTQCTQAVLFKDSDASGLAMGENRQAYDAGGGGYEASGCTKAVVFSYKMTAGSTSAMTFKVRLGSLYGTAYVNSDLAGSYTYGNIMSCSLKVTELVA